MNTVPNRRPRITALRLVVFFVLACFVTGAFRTPNSWSDVHSQWFPTLLMASISLVLCLAVRWVYIRPGGSPKIQAIVLWLLFGGVFTLCVGGLLQSQQFMALYGRNGPFDYLRHPGLFFNFPWGHF